MSSPFVLHVGTAAFTIPIPRVSKFVPADRENDTVATTNFSPRSSGRHLHPNVGSIFELQNYILEPIMLIRGALRATVRGLRPHPVSRSVRTARRPCVDEDGRRRVRLGGPTRYLPAAVTGANPELCAWPTTRYPRVLLLLM